MEIPKGKRLPLLVDLLAMVPGIPVPLPSNGAFVGQEVTWGFLAGSEWDGPTNGAVFETEDGAVHALTFGKFFSIVITEENLEGRVFLRNRDAVGKAKVFVSVTREGTTFTQQHEFDLVPAATDPQASLLKGVRIRWGELED